MKISEILWLAANKYLWTGDDYDLPNGSPYSCDAVTFAENNGEWDYSHSEAIDFLRGLGCPGGNYAFAEFEVDSDCDKHTDESQGARYAWLMFASMYAEELGL